MISFDITNLHNLLENKFQFFQKSIILYERIDKNSKTLKTKIFVKQKNEKYTQKNFRVLYQ